MARPTRRQVAEEIVREVIAEYQGDDRKELRRLISEEYPWYERRYWPYKVWLDVVRKELAAWTASRTPPRTRTNEGVGRPEPEVWPGAGERPYRGRPRNGRGTTMTKTIRISDISGKPATHTISWERDMGKRDAMGDTIYDLTCEEMDKILAHLVAPAHLSNQDIVEHIIERLQESKSIQQNRILEQTDWKTLTGKREE